MENNKIRSYHDLRVYQRAYNASLIVMKEVVPKLPDFEKYDLKSQLSRSAKAIPRLIAEGFAKKHQKAGYQKYLDDAMGESNESQVSLCQSNDIYPFHVDVSVCNYLISEYDITGKELFRLRETWTKFSSLPPKLKYHDQKSTEPNDQTLNPNPNLIAKNQTGSPNLPPKT
jgi:four helix bundle protein